MFEIVCAYVSVLVFVCSWCLIVRGIWRWCMRVVVHFLSSVIWCVALCLCIYVCSSFSVSIMCFILCVNVLLVLSYHCSYVGFFSARLHVCVPYCFVC